MAKLRHIALSVKDPEKTAQFYEQAFDLERVGETDSPLAKGIYLSDGVINIALLSYKSDEMSGYVGGEDERGKDFEGIHHMGFVVDNLKEAEEKIESAGGKYLMGRPNSSEPNTFYEMKFRDPQGVIVDVTHLGWKTNRKHYCVS
jgi:catechol 2,3-dioxygenase-like lactoylglutathione lyase family enzyme